MKFSVNFTNNITLKYNLINHEIVTSWKNLIEACSISDLCPNNHYLGYASKQLVEQRIERLNYLADTINSFVPARVIKHPITTDNYQTSLSIMHVHFPDLKNNNAYEFMWDMLTEYNDIIHWLEASMPLIEKSSFFRVTLDFNKANKPFLPIPDSAYELFTNECNFGDLLLHYTHVGKNASELFTTNDLVCPPDQFVPQRTFSASVRMHFFDNFHNTPEKKDRLQRNWKQFYETRGGKQFWRHDFNDPKIAFGFMKIGSLESITVANEMYPIPRSNEELNDFRNRLVETSVMGWIIE